MSPLKFRPLAPSLLPLKVMPGCATCGFPSPAADYYEPPLSLDELMNIRAPHVWLVEVEGDSMRDVGIFHGTRLVVDRSITPCSGHIVLAYVDNQPLVKRLAKSPTGWLLESENPAYRTIRPEEYSAIEVFGVVTWDLTQHAQ